MSSTIDGLVSGLSTSSLISQLMQVEAAPQNRLQTKVSTEQTKLNAYQSVNSKLAALETAADNVSTLSNWRTTKATSSSSSVAATGGTTGVTGTVTFDVVNLARAQVTTARVAGTGDIASGGTLQLTTGTNDPVAIDISADRSAAGVASAINAKSATLGVRASVITTTDGETVLQLSGTKTGAANAFTLTGLDAGTTDAVAAQDATLKVGDPNTGGYTVGSASNTFTNLISGSSITVTKPEENVTVEVTGDSGSIAAKMKALVDAANSALKEIDTQSATSGTKKSALSGDFTVRQASTKILSAVSGGLTDFGSLSQLGIQLTRDGTLSFDAEKFKTAYEASPDSIKTASTAFAAKVKTLADDQQTELTNVINSRTSLIKNLNKQIDNWDVRLASHQVALQKQFASLETSLSTMKNQSNWLAGQISGLG